MERDQIIESLLADFILKDRRDRCRLELTNPKKRHGFINKLNHQWNHLFDERKFIKINQGIETADQIESLIPLKGKTKCYVVSNNPEIDDAILTFEQAIEEAFAYGFGSMIYDYENGLIYLEGEQGYGPPDRLIGRK